MVRTHGEGRLSGSRDRKSPSGMRPSFGTGRRRGRIKCTHTHTHKRAPPTAFSWPASPVPHRNTCFKIYVSPFNENVGGVSPAAIVSHYVKQKRLAKTHQNVYANAQFNMQVRHSDRNSTVTRLEIMEIIRNRLNAVRSPCHCNVTHFGNKLQVFKKDEM